MKKKGQEREQRRKEQEDLVEQADLILIKEPPRLVDVYIRPTLEGKRNSGFLLIHKNGLRYQTTTGRKVGNISIISRAVIIIKFFLFDFTNFFFFSTKTTSRYSI